MTKFNLIDTVNLSDKGFTKTAEGYLDANVRTVRTGIQHYDGASLGRPDLGVVAVYRPESEVFDIASLNTFARLPVTDDHPTGFVDAGNWKDLAVGMTGESVLRDGEFLKIGMRITDAATIAAIEAGKREVSAGYQSQITFEDGVTPEGEPYQARQSNIVANHVAVVDRARAGSKARIGDSAQTWGGSPVTVTDRKEKPQMADLIMKMVDGLQVQTTDAGGTAIDKLIADKAALQSKALTDAQTHSATLDAKDVELADRDAQIATLTAGQLTDSALDAKVAERVSLLTDAKLVAPDLVTDGLSSVDIHKGAIAVAAPTLSMDGKSDAYLAARFDGFVDAAKVAADADPLQKLVDTGTGTKRVVADNVTDLQDKRDANLADAWKGKSA